MSAATSTAPRVSVLMTMYNAARDLRAAVESVRVQTFTDFEFIIVDDGSTDDSVALVESCADPRIRLVRNATNKGQTACLNQGLALARGEWIARQDADDLSHPTRIERQLDAVARDETLALVGCQAWIIDGAGAFEGTLNLPLGPASIEWAALFENPFIHTAAFFRREVIVGLGGYDEAFRICQDYDLWERVLRTQRGLNLPARLVQYRHTALSLSQAARETVHAESLRVRSALWSRLFAEGKFSAEEAAAFLRGGGRASASEAAAFSGVCKRVRDAYLQTRPQLADDRDFCRTAALQHAQIGRDALAENLRTGLTELVRAFALDPCLLLRLATDRLVGPWQSSLRFSPKTPRKTLG